MSLHLHRPHRAPRRGHGPIDEHLLTALTFAITWAVMCAAIVLHYATSTR